MSVRPAPAILTPAVVTDGVRLGLLKPFQPSHSRYGNSRGMGAFPSGKYQYDC